MQRHSRELLLDVSDLEPPEPLQRTLKALETLEPGQYLRMLHRRQPELLYPMLKKSGFCHDTYPGASAPFEILIWRDGDTEAEHACRRLSQRANPTTPVQPAGGAGSFGLSLDQAPPINIPLRFIQTAPLFGLLTAIIIMIAGPDNWLSRWNPTILGATHMITLGFLAMAMMGAMMQMLPVVAGSPIQHAQRWATMIYLLYVPGILMLVTGLIWTLPVLIRSAVFMLATALGLFILASCNALHRVPVKTHTTTAMRLAVISLVITLIMGLLMAASRGWTISLPQSHAMVSIHLAWGLLGWIGLLVIGVSYQVVPMFQMTPPYPNRMMRWLAPLLFTLLILWSLLNYLSQTMVTGLRPFALVTEMLLITCMSAYAITTLYLQKQRRRRLVDTTILFWRLAMSSLLAAALLWLGISMQLLPADTATFPILLGIIVLIGFTQSVINGMMYKIVPFLVWLHLQTERGSRGKLPNMKQIIPEQRARTQFRLHFTALLLLLATATYPQWFTYPAALLFAASQLLLATNIAYAWRTYRRIISTVIA